MVHNKKTGENHAFWINLSEIFALWLGHLLHVFYSLKKLEKLLAKHGRNTETSRKAIKRIPEWTLHMSGENTLHLE